MVELLLDELDPGCLRRNTTQTFAWQRREMLVDNVLSTYGREPFTGKRRIPVGMAAAGVASV